MFEAEKKLLDLGMMPLKVARMLVPIELILDNADFWKNQKGGFAAFLTPDSFVCFSLLSQIQELVIVSDRFHLKPLLRNDLQGNNFYLLTLTHTQLKFFEASEKGLNEIFLRGMPRSLEHFLLSVELKSQIQINSRGYNTTIYQKNCEVEENKKIKMLRFFGK